jgi:hypothetical protein
MLSYVTVWETRTTSEGPGVRAGFHVEGEVQLPFATLRIDGFSAKFGIVSWCVWNEAGAWAAAAPERRRNNVKDNTLIPLATVMGSLPRLLSFRTRSTMAESLPAAAARLIPGIASPSNVGC